MDVDSSRLVDSRLCPRHTTRFKKSTRNNSNIMMREETMFKKAFELSTLCDIQLCLLYYDREGELTNTWPEDRSKVTDIAQRFFQSERPKKSTNLSQFINKKIMDEKKHDFNKFSVKVLDLKNSLQTQLPILRDQIRHHHLNYPQTQSTEDPQPLMNLSTDQQLTEPWMDLLTDLPTTFDQPHNYGYGFSDLLLGGQGFDGYNNIDMTPPLMQTQTPLLHYDQFAS